MSSPFIGLFIQHPFSLALPGPQSFPVIKFYDAYPDCKVPIQEKKINDLKKVSKYIELNEESSTFYQDAMLWPTLQKKWRRLISVHIFVRKYSILFYISANKINFVS